MGVRFIQYCDNCGEEKTKRLHTNMCRFADEKSKKTGTNYGFRVKIEHEKFANEREHFLCDKCFLNYLKKAVKQLEEKLKASNQMPKQCRLCGGVSDFCGKNIYGEDVYKCRICKETGHHSRFKEITSIDEREKLIASLVISVFHNACEGIKTETLQKVKKLIEVDKMAYYYDGGE